LITLIVAVTGLVLVAAASANGFGISLDQSQPVAVGEQLSAQVTARAVVQIQVVCGGVVEDHPFYSLPAQGTYDLGVGTVTNPGSCTLELWSAKVSHDDLVPDKLMASEQFTVG
jgi:hypothetical protein